MQQRRFLEMELNMTPSYGGSGGNNTAAAEHDAFSDTFDTMVIILVAVVALLCAFICGLGLNSIGCFGDDMAELTEERLAGTGLKRHVYGAAGGENTIPATECPICLSEFEKGDRVRMWPKCNHGFHVRCIDTWLLSHSSCPNCRQSLLEKPAAVPESGHYFSRFTFY